MAPITNNTNIKTTFTAVEESELDFATLSFHQVQAWLAFRGQDQGQVQFQAYEVERSTYELKLTLTAYVYCSESSKIFGMDLYKNVYTTYTYTNY